MTLKCEVCGVSPIPFENVFSHFAMTHSGYDPLQHISVVLDDKTLMTLISNALKRTAIVMSQQFRDLGVHFNPEIQIDNDRSEVMLSFQWTPSNGPFRRMPFEQVPGFSAMLLNTNPSSFQRHRRARLAIASFISRLLTRISSGVQSITH